MKALKCMISGALLILLGPVLSLLDVMFSGAMVLCWLVGIPLFVIGLLIPEKGSAKNVQLDGIPQKTCPKCGRNHDFDYPKCPFCGHDYQAKRIQ